MDSLHTKLIRLGVCTTKCNGDQDDSRRVLVVDGGTLVYALDPSIKRLFLSVADRFHSVMCCRATPLQKVWNYRFSVGCHRERGSMLASGTMLS